MIKNSEVTADRTPHHLDDGCIGDQGNAQERSHPQDIPFVPDPLCQTKFLNAPGWSDQILANNRLERGFFVDAVDISQCDADLFNGGVGTDGVDD